MVSDDKETEDIGVLVTPHRLTLARLQTQDFDARCEREVIEWLESLATRTQPTIVTSVG